VTKPIPETKFYIPGKTFLVGEYSVLLGGSALGLATSPFFEFSIVQKDATEFHPESPAGRLLASRHEKSDVQFFDSYSDLGVYGGFGRSTAEFLAAYSPELLKRKKSAFEILQTYKNLHSDQKVKPSGMDLVFQLLGGVTLADQKLNLFQNFDWNFSNLDFLLISSGLKVQTHDHLAQLDPESLTELPDLSNLICGLYAENNEAEFLYQMKQWCELLKAKKIIHDNSLQIRSELESFNPIKLVKPCGALGADVLIVFFDRADRAPVLACLEQKKLKVVSSSSDLASGLISQLRPYWSQNVG
jgi:mevalonate kinase